MARLGITDLAMVVHNHNNANAEKQKKKRNMAPKVPRKKTTETIFYILFYSSYINVIN